MISVEFRTAGPGQCGWCLKQLDEVFDVAFSDKSFIGPLCKADLLRAVRMKCPASKPEPKPVVAQPNGTPPVAVPAK